MGGICDAALLVPLSNGRLGAAERGRRLLLQSVHLRTLAEHLLGGQAAVEQGI
jgi:hypothetical protein